MENNPKYIIRLNQKAGELFIESLTNISSNEEKTYILRPEVEKALLAYESTRTINVGRPAKNTLRELIIAWESSSSAKEAAVKLNDVPANITGRIRRLRELNNIPLKKFK